MDSNAIERPGAFAFAVLILLGTLPPSAIASAQEADEQAPLQTADLPADSDKVAAARTVFDEWIEAYQTGEYETQWLLNDPRKRYWVKEDRWSKAMRRSARRRGDIAEYDIYASFPVEAEQIPCTEQGHCFRKGVEYVMFLIRSRYEGRNQPPQPEFAVMSMSEEGWRYAGGTFPFHPMGETSVLLDERDEARYRNHVRDTAPNRL